MTDDIRTAFSEAGKIRAQQIRDERERRENPRKTTSENGKLFATAMQARLDQLAEESGIADITGHRNN